MRFYKPCDGKCGRKHDPQTAAQTKLVEHIKTNYINENGKYTICLTYMLNGKCKCDKNNPLYNYEKRHIYWKSIQQKKQCKRREQVVNKELQTSADMSASLQRNQVVECVQPAAPERDSFNMPMMDAIRAEINELKRLIIRLTAPSETKTGNEKMNTISIQTELEMVEIATQTELVAPIEIETQTEIETVSQETQTESIDEGIPPGPPDVLLPIQEILTIKNKIEPAAITNWDMSSITDNKSVLLTVLDKMSENPQNTFMEFTSLLNTLTESIPLDEFGFPMEINS